MYMLPEFPAIPEVVTGQVLSATTLNTYHEGLRHLLGSSRSRQPIQEGTTLWVPVPRASGFVQIYFGYAALNGWTIYYNMFLKDGDWTWAVQVNNGSWVTVASGSGTGSQQVTGTATLVGYGLTAGLVYPFQVVVDSTSAFQDSSASVWALTIRPTISGWVAPPTFVNGAVSSAADFNAIRTDLNALNALVPAIGWSLPGTGGSNSDKGVWATVWRGSFRFRTDMSLYVSCEALGYTYDSDPFKAPQWQVLINYPTRDGEYWVNRPLLTHYFTTTEGLLTPSAWVRFEAIISAATLGALTPGTYYSIVYVLYIPTPDDPADNPILQICRPCAHVIMPAGAYSGWPTLTEWAEGDQVTAARMNAISTGLTNLYTGGANALFVETPVSAAWPSALIIHQKPWLIVASSPGVTITVWYAGEIGSYTESFTIKAEAGETFTSTLIDGMPGMTYGSRYLVAGAFWAAESTEPYT